MALIDKLSCFQYCQQLCFVSTDEFTQENVVFLQKQHKRRKHDVAH